MINAMNLRKYRGQILTPKKIKEICGYSPKTYILDTRLIYKGFIKRVRWERPHLYKVL